MVCFLLFLSPTLSLFLSPEIVNMSKPRSTSEERDEPTEFRDKIKSSSVLSNQPDMGIEGVGSNSAPWSIAEFFPMKTLHPFENNYHLLSLISQTKCSFSLTQEQ